MTPTQANETQQVAQQFAPDAAAEFAHDNDVMMEQLEYLMGLAAEHGLCDCSACRRYMWVRSALLEIFEPRVTAA